MSVACDSRLTSYSHSLNDYLPDTIYSIKQRLYFIRPSPPLCVISPTPWNGALLEKANSSSARQEILRILWNPKVHCRIHKSPPPVLILSQVNPLHAPHLISWRSILISSSHLGLGLPSGLFPSGLPHQTMCLSLSSATCVPHAPPIPFFLFDHPNNVLWGDQIMKLLILQSLRLPWNLVPVRPKYLPQHPILEHPQPMFVSFNNTINCWDYNAW